MIANLLDTAEGDGHWIRASVSQDGTFTVTNSRNGLVQPNLHGALSRLRAEPVV